MSLLYDLLFPFQWHIQTTAHKANPWLIATDQQTTIIQTALHILIFEKGIQTQKCMEPKESQSIAIKYPFIANDNGVWDIQGKFIATHAEKTRDRIVQVILTIADKYTIEYKDNDTPASDDTTLAAIDNGRKRTLSTKQNSAALNAVQRLLVITHHGVIKAYKITHNAVSFMYQHSLQQTVNHARLTQNNQHLILGGEKLYVYENMGVSGFAPLRVQSLVVFQAYQPVTYLPWISNRARSSIAAVDVSADNTYIITVTKPSCLYLWQIRPSTASYQTVLLRNRNFDNIIERAHFWTTDKIVLSLRGGQIAILNLDLEEIACRPSSLGTTLSLSTTNELVAILAHKCPLAPQTKHRWTAPFIWFINTFLWHFEEDHISTMKESIYCLINLVLTTHEEIFKRKINQRAWDEALDYALKHELNTDQVYQQKWLTEEMTEESLVQNLNNVKDKEWVLQSCVDRTAPTPKAQRQLLQYGLRIADDLPTFYEKYRIKLESYLERLNTFKLLNKPFNPEFQTFKQSQLLDVAISMAQNQEFDGITIMFERHPLDTLKHRFTILQAIPESTPPSMYEHLLPRMSLHTRMEEIIGVDAQPGEYLTQWYLAGISRIEAMGLLKYTTEFIEIGIMHNISGLEEIRKQMQIMSRIIYNSSSETLAYMLLRNFIEMDMAQMIALILEGNSTVQCIRDNVIPFIEFRTPDYSQVLVQYLSTYASTNLELVFDIVSVTSKGEPLFDSNDAMLNFVLKAFNNCKRADEITWELMRKTVDLLLDSGRSEDLTEGIDLEAQGKLTQTTPTFIPKASDPFLTPRKRLFSEPREEEITQLDHRVLGGRILFLNDMKLPLGELRAMENSVEKQKALLDNLTINNADAAEWSLSDWSEHLVDLLCLHETVLCCRDLDEIWFLWTKAALNYCKFEAVRATLSSNARQRNPISETAIRNLVIETAKMLFLDADSCNANEGLLKDARLCLQLIAPDSQIETELNLIEACTFLGTRHVTLRHPLPLLPIQVRSSNDRMSLFRQALENDPGIAQNLDYCMRVVAQLGYKDKISKSKAYFALLRVCCQHNYLTTAFECVDRMLALCNEDNAPAIKRDGWEEWSHDWDEQIEAATSSVSVSTTELPILRRLACDACVLIANWPGKHTRGAMYIIQALNLASGQDLVDILALWKKSQRFPTKINTLTLTV